MNDYGINSPESQFSRNVVEIDINRDQYLELEKLAFGVFAPLKGFMDESDFNSCVDNMRLSDGSIFPIPIVFDICEEIYQKVKSSKCIDLCNKGGRIGRILPSSFYKPNKLKVAKSIYGTEDSKHPGVSHFKSLGEYFVGGQIELFNRVQFEFSRHELTPTETREYFQKMNWKTIVGFQTRNVPHRAHEYLQKSALETVDGIFIQPLVGKKKRGDFTPEAVIAGYEALIEYYYPSNRVLFGILSTVMRYAGPREAVFHAIIRRNYGCTHFIVGRDHAGMCGYYDKYAAHELVETFGDELGIEVLKMKGPYFCSRCEGIVTEKTCPHGDTHPEYSFQISGTYIRDLIKKKESIDSHIIREEVVQSLQGFNILI